MCSNQLSYWSSFAASGSGVLRFCGCKDRGFRRNRQIFFRLFWRQGRIFSSEADFCCYRRMAAPEFKQPRCGGECPQHAVLEVAHRRQRIELAPTQSAQHNVDEVPIRAVTHHQAQRVGSEVAELVVEHVAERRVCSSRVRQSVDDGERVAQQALPALHGGSIDDAVRARVVYICIA